MLTSPHARPEARRRIFDVLACPVCHERLEPADRVLRCPRRHAFDIARHGYVSLLTGNRRPAGQDTAAMVQARTAFLEAGHYAPLTGVLAGLAEALCPPGGTVLDAGAGTGHHLAAVLDALPSAVGLGLDTSAHALRRAARAHPRAAAARADLWQPLPVRTGSADLVVNVFAPRNGPEFQRVLRPGGAVVVVTPGPRHLGELRRHLGLLAVDPAKEARLHRTLSAHFDLDRTETLEYVLALSPREVADAVAMGPSAHHIDREELERRVALLPSPFPVTAAFRVSVYRELS